MFSDNVEIGLYGDPVAIMYFLKTFLLFSYYIKSCYLNSILTTFSSKIKSTSFHLVVFLFLMLVSVINLFSNTV